MQQTKHHKEKERIDNGRYVETLFRVTFSNQIHLIQIADNKANSIITINTLVITLLIGLTGYGSITRGAELRSLNMVPVILLTLTCLLSVIFALMAAQPRIIKANKSQEKKSSDSLLFFGTIPERTLSDYLADMDELTNSPLSVHHALEIEIYNQSKVLSKKYKFLRIAFLIFMYGIISSIVAFILIYLLNFN